MLDVLFRLMFIGIVATLWKDCQLTFRQMTIKLDPLLNIEKETPIRVKDQSRTAYRTEEIPQVEHAFAVSAPVAAKLVEKVFGVILPVPLDELLPEIGFKVPEGFWKFQPIKLHHGHGAVTLGA